MKNVKILAPLESLYLENPGPLMIMMILMMITNMFNVLEVEKPNRSLGSQTAKAEKDNFSSPTTILTKIEILISMKIDHF